MCSSQAACPYILECTSMLYSVMWSRAGPRDTMIPLVSLWGSHWPVHTRYTHLSTPLNSTHCPSTNRYPTCGHTSQGFYSSPKFHYKRDPYKYAVHLAMNPPIAVFGFQILVNGLIINIMLSYSPSQEASFWIYFQSKYLSIPNSFNFYLLALCTVHRDKL